MSFQNVEISKLRVNPANDRHGELRDEQAAIGELFHLHDIRMRALAQDITEAGRVYDPPLVILHDGHYTVFDGNRRITCLKLLLDPEKAPSDELRQFFREQRGKWSGRFPSNIVCQIEDSRDSVDEILFRRHTGTQGGVGQIGWDDRAKTNFIERTGRGTSTNISAAVEALLEQEGRLPKDKIPWSTMTRLLSSEQFRGRVGLSLAGKQFRLTHEREPVLTVLERIASDLATGNLTLGHLWNNDGKRRYLDGLEAEGLLPTEHSRLAEEGEQPEIGAARPKGRKPLRRPPSRTFIPADAPSISWGANQHRLSNVWNELASLPLNLYPNAVAALVRMLVELATEGYLLEHDIVEKQDLSRRVGAVARSLRDRDLIDEHYLNEIERIRRDDALISITSMQRLLHSPDFAPMEAEFRAYWNRLSRYIILAIAL